MSQSKYLRELKAWINFNAPVPHGSVAQRLMQGSSRIEDYDELPTDVWFGRRHQEPSGGDGGSPPIAGMESVSFTHLV